MQTSLKALSWLVGFRISLLAYYAARVVLSEVDKEMYATNTSAGGTSTSTGNTNGASASNSSNIANNTSSTSCAVSKRCSLCIDALVSPAVVPCGHIFCWNCIVPYATNTSASVDGDTSSSSGGVKCPICRTEFQAQNIRALHNYV